MNYYARTRLTDNQLQLLSMAIHPAWQSLGIKLRSDHLPFDDRLTLTVRYMRQGVTQQELGEEYDIGQQTVSDIVREILPLIVDLGVTVRDGTVLRGLEETLDYLERHGGYVLLDGTLVAHEDVDLPGHFSGKHHLPGVNLQVLGDVYGQPLWVSEPLPGARQDSGAARELGLPAEFTARPNLKVLADLGYARDYAVLPFKKCPGGELTLEQKLYNEQHSSIRAAIEWAIRRIKTWRLLRRKSQPRHLIGLVARAAVVLESVRRWW